jgi:hypothetical protein
LAVDQRLLGRFALRSSCDATSASGTRAVRFVYFFSFSGLFEVFFWPFYRFSIHRAYAVVLSRIIVLQHNFFCEVNFEPTAGLPVRGAGMREQFVGRDLLGKTHRPALQQSSSG